MAVLSWLTRDALISGTEDAPYGRKIQKEQQGGAHYLNVTNAKEVNEVILEIGQEPCINRARKHVITSRLRRLKKINYVK
ncbi:hypothetical protein P171DRAFT_487502 [Karstenula rhodostoma CBS 690.94]|uniref:Uncharacterized protein n=1 Tax=Karstenula rhodostoma CBS 690.94 TaxID=1392251 RepID=A0A9P4UAN0_9PLEO|nr:hypothetical protein P171DRAFT_487502 [Karstenula rhodostoma CBS 690.94]